MYSPVILFAAFVLLTGGETARILGLFPFPAKSHFNVMSPLLQELAKRGHQVTVISPFPRKLPLKNYNDITIPDEFENNSEEINPFEMAKVNHMAMLIFVRQFTVENCRKIYTYPQIQELIKSNKEFDLIIYEPFFHECIYGLFHKFKAPTIQISSNTIACWMGEGVGNPNFFSYIPDLFTGYADHMSFSERLYNSFFQTFAILHRELYVVPQHEAIIREHFSDPTLPSIQELENNASFLLLNTHVAFNYPRPLTPNTAEVAGMHITEPKKLPQDLQKYLDNAPNGVIYFSMGSSIPSVSMPEEMRDSFVKAFSEMKQKVLWKWEADTLPGKSENVLISKWLPQTDILAHPNVKVFITHGGLLSTQEATYFGVPLVAVPVGRDQNSNARHAQEAGYAVVLNLKNITTESVKWALNEILSKQSFADNAKRYSRIFKDQTHTPLEKAVFWTEYVLRHKGAPHMKSAALNLNFFQYYLLDIIAVVTLCSVVVLVITVISCKALCHRIFSKSVNSKHIKQAKKNN